MGQAKLRGKKEDRIKEAIERGDVKYPSEVERHMGIHKISKPIVDGVFKDVMDLLIHTNSAKDYGINDIDQLHYKFHSGNHPEITVLFWHFLYKNPEYRKFDSVDYCHGCEKYSLYQNGTTYCGLGFSKSKIESYYESVEERLKGIDASSQDHIVTILECFHDMPSDVNKHK